MGDAVLLMFPALIVLIALGIPIAFSMVLVASVFGFIRFEEIVFRQFAQRVDEVASNYVLGAIPLFIFMGAILERAGIAERLFDAIYMWTRRLPGGLAIAALVMCTIFAAASGVVGATETLVGMLAIPAMLKRKYDNSLIAGTICAGGSLGTVIPPSIPVIVLAPIMTLPVGDLMAGILVPGLMMAAMFSLYIIVSATLKPSLAPRDTDPDPFTMGEKIRFTLKALVPPVVLIALVLGTLFSGLATPTEAAACGSAGVLFLALCYGKLSFKMVLDASLQTVSLTAMILAIVLAGVMFSGVLFASGGMMAIRGFLDSFGFGTAGVIALILIITFILGFAVELTSIVLIMTSISVPILKLYDVDLLWFSIVFLITLQTSYLTPPMAPSIFYLRAIAPPTMTLKQMYWGVIPFIICQLIVLALVITFPELATWMPKLIYG
ncbi:TRAP transporter large permease [Salipiger bermudensis]|uniref:TRAP transporter large permease protein n=1 Tax=Salipiger bermudensis (strain DSM 26914 / JCM 13377 / KCTC 12554 / HTCC2601) TaxID=314265 RepID=Q0FUQ6_SALBH|nr:TRAP transporter large permease subunit [Salipiger bermudensis]EAU48025.1 TRAP transporter, DctM subunit [Salipiger bermudensis HTCC2601]MBR9891306.1 TRAP transporter large permease subunit [bacterium]